MKTYKPLTPEQKAKQAAYVKRRRQENPEWAKRNNYIRINVRLGYLTWQEAKPYDHHTLKTVIVPRKRMLKRIKESTEKLEQLTNLIS